MSAYETILVEQTDHVATISLNRPEARNGITPKMLDELYAAVQDAAADKQLRVLVLRGAGRDFCPGADVKAYAAGNTGPSRPETFTVSVILHECPLVTIAAIRGACAGAGMGWASACDLRICDDTARFNTAFLDVGLSGDMGGSWFLPRILGAAKARELYFLPGKFDAAEAARIGLVSRVYPEAAFEAELDALVDRLANSSPLALKGMKANFVESEHMSLSDFIASETARHTACGRTEDSREAFRAFVEKRKPVFQGALTMAEDILDPDLEICDPHHHLWDFAASRYLLPELLGDLTSGHNITSTVFVECGSFYRAGASEAMRYVGETEFVNGQAAMAASGRYGPILACEGMVGRADLSQGASVAEVLEAHVRAGGGRFKGIRHAGAWDASPDVRNGHTNPPQGLYALPAFREGFAKLGELGLSFEAWQYHPQLGEVAALADANPGVTILLNHVGGPLGIGPYAGDRDGVFAAWKAGIEDLARRPNVWVKLGGLGMTTCGFGFHRRDPRPGSAELADAWRPYLETCIAAFGVERGMFESNFPVDGASCDYPTLWNALKRVAAGCSADEKAALFKGNARRFYRLD